MSLKPKAAAKETYGSENCLLERRNLNLKQTKYVLNKSYEIYFSFCFGSLITSIYFNKLNLIQMESSGSVTAELEKVKELEISTRRILYWGGTYFSLAGFISVAFLFYEIISKEFHQSQLIKPVIYHTQFELWSSHSSEIEILFVLFTFSILAFLCFRGAGSINRNVIPDADRSLLTSLIIKDEQGIDQYIRLSSLSGTTGFFTKLGLTGLPLATIGLTILFTLLYMGSGNVTLFDLAKLTLGAFLGSYVQKAVPSPVKQKSTDENEKKLKGTKISESENPYTESGPKL